MEANKIHSHLHDVNVTYKTFQSILQCLCVFSLFNKMKSVLPPLCCVKCFRSSCCFVLHNILQATEQAVLVFVSIIPNHCLSLSSNIESQRATKNSAQLRYFLNCAFFSELWLSHETHTAESAVSERRPPLPPPLLHAATRPPISQFIFDVCQMCSNRSAGARCNDRLLKRNFIAHQQANSKPHLPSTSQLSSL